MANDLEGDSVLADLETRAKAGEAVLENKEKIVADKTPVAVPPMPIKEESKADKKESFDDDEDMFISLGDLQEKIAEFKKSSSEKKDKKNKEVKKVVETRSTPVSRSGQAPNIVSSEETEKIADIKEIDDEPVLANPVMQTVSIAPVPVEVKNKTEENLVPEIDLDAEDLFAEEKKKENLSKDSLEKIDIKSKQELARGKKQRTAVVQNIMKTETIYDRSKKPEKAKRSFGGSKKDEYKTLAPVEELEVLSLEEWRRLGDIPEERMLKVKEKIEILGEKGILSQIKGLNAWRSSPVMQHYLDLGIQALLDKKGVEEYVEVLDDDTNLSYQEWMAINKLNSQLMI
jgi:hypothetical protein